MQQSRMDRRGLLGRSRGAAAFAVVALLIGACSAPVGPSAAAVATASPAADPSSTATTTEQPSPSPDAVATQSVAPIGTTSPSTPTRSAAPTPKPTLNWAASGCTASVRDPVAIGAKAKVTIKCPVGPTCTLKITYPSGTSATLPSPTHPNPGWWTWTWTVPTGAKAGEAAGTSTCTYAGDPHKGPVGFTITAASAGWSIRVDMPATHAHDALREEGIEITTTIVGTLEKNPSYAIQKIICSFVLDTPGGYYQDGFEGFWVDGDPPLFWEYQLLMNEADIGTASWSMKCRNLFLDTIKWEYDSGTIAIT